MLNLEFLFHNDDQYGAASADDYNAPPSPKNEDNSKQNSNNWNYYFSLELVALVGLIGSVSYSLYSFTKNCEIPQVVMSGDVV